jgi:hypothetical protein
VPKRSPPLRGVVEGYYGRPWPGEARRDVIRFMGAHGLDTFVYGPKNDPYHRDRWREPYPEDALADFAETARVARRAKVRFVVAISPGLDVCYACKDDFTALTRKIRQLRRGGHVRYFALFYDDVFGGLQRDEDVARYRGNDEAALARAHADLTNRADRWLRAQGLPGLVFMVPSDYCGTECRPYHAELGRKLRRGMPIGWTGSGVFAETLTGAEARAFRAAVGNHPVVLWDNFPVNDTVLAHNLHLGPLTGRDADLTRAVHGHLLNPMTQPYASQVALGTAAAYFADPSGYDAESAWRASLAALDPGGGLAVLAEQTRSSAIDLDDARALAAIVADVAASHAGPDWTQAIDALDAEIARQAAASTAIATSLAGTPLGDEIAPWVAELTAHTEVARQAAALLRALKPAIEVTRAPSAGGTLHVRGTVRPPDGAVIDGLGLAFATPPPVPGIGELLAGMGNVTSADIRFSPELGLNVHGKALYLVPYSLTDVRTITGRNVHQRLLELVADRYGDYVSRRGPRALALTIDGTPVALDDAGAFDVTIPLRLGSRATLLATTAAGDATSRVVP